MLSRCDIERPIPMKLQVLSSAGQRIIRWRGDATDLVWSTSM